MVNLDGASHRDARTSCTLRNDAVRLRALGRGRFAFGLSLHAAWRLLLCVMLLAGSAVAQEQKRADLGELSIEDLAKMKVESVYGASKFLQKASDVPSSVTVVTAEQIQKYGYRTLADLLK